MAQADEFLIRSLLENLMSNAWKFTAEGTNGVIEIGMEQTDRGPAYYVRDNGIGFDPSHSATLFQPFLRLHSEDEYAGSGVGLATAARIIERHHGEIWAIGQPGVGATFYFTLGPKP
jgi:light-regulated signal transduction histidine kinase (bacteriophytochrome)